MATTKLKPASKSSEAESGDAVRDDLIPTSIGGCGLIAVSTRDAGQKTMPCGVAGRCVPIDRDARSTSRRDAAVRRRATALHGSAAG